MKRTARLLVTLACSRGCGYCCNAIPGVQEQFRPLADLDDLDDYAEIVLSGGEPMEAPKLTRGIVYELFTRQPLRPIYLYTARYVPELAPMLPMLRGITYTLHKGATAAELERFQKMQRALRSSRRLDSGHRTDRLAMDGGGDLDIVIDAGVWAEVRVKHWECAPDSPVFDAEDLFVWRTP